MVFIRKRKTPDDAVAEMLIPEWKRVFRVPVLASFANDPYGLTNQKVEATHLLDIASRCKRGTLLNVPLADRIFLYLFCFITWRTMGKSLLTDDAYMQLSNHLHSGKWTETIDKQEGISLKHRMAFIWDVPEIGATFRGAETMSLPADPITAPTGRTNNRLQRVKPSTKKRKKPLKRLPRKK